MANRRRTAYAMLGGFVVSFAVLLYVLWQLVMGAAAGRPNTPAAPPTPIAIPPNAARFSSLAEFERSPKGLAGAPFVITITEAELNSRVSEGVAKQPDLPFRNVTARVLDDRVDFNGQVRAAGLEIPAKVGLRPTAASSRLAYELTGIDLGPIGVPGVARGAISDTIDRELANAKLFDGFALDAVQARQGAVTLVGRFK